MIDRMVMNMRFRGGFTLVEIMIVVAIIGLLMGIAVPNFIRAKGVAEKNACIGNMKRIEGALQVWAIDTGESSDAQPQLSDLVPSYLRSWPTCKGVSYAVPAVNVEPSCPNNISGHTLSPSSSGSGTTA
jgi:prepilin-type N-terminal cleavage/methylation domain-containing protein